MAETKHDQSGPGRPRRVTVRRLAWPAAALLVAGLTLPFAAVHAQAAPSDDSSFILGEAQGLAQGLRISPAIGSNFQVAITVGTSIGGYSDTEGKASAQNLDLGAVGTSLTSPQCDGSAPTFQSSQLPQPIVAESPNGQPQTAHQDITGGSSTAPADVGVLDAASTGAPAPSGTASTQGTAFNLPGLVDVSGVRTSATGGVVGGNARDVTAAISVGAISLAGGLVQLGNVQESVHQRTGAGATTAGTFTVGSLTVAGTALPVAADQLTSSLAAANAALTPTGLYLTAPVFSTTPDGSAHMSPLAVGIANSSLGHTVVAPVVGSSLATQLEDQLVAANCQVTTPLAIASLFLLNPASGAGALNLLVGGVDASSDGTQYADPFGDFGLLSSAPESLDTSAGNLDTSGTDGSLGASGLGNTGSTGPASQAAGTTNAADSRVVGQTCSTTAVFQHPGCYGNYALPVGIGALAVVMGLGYADAMRGRREWFGRLRGKRALDDLKL